MATKPQHRRWQLLRREYQRGPWLICGILLTIGMIMLALALGGVFG